MVVDIDIKVDYHDSTSVAQKIKLIRKFLVFRQTVSVQLASKHQFAGRRKDPRSPIVHPNWTPFSRWDGVSVS